MRVASYNLYQGAQDTYPLLKEFVEQQEIDVLCLQEVNDWQNGSANRLHDFSETTGLSYYIFGDSNTKYKLATFSRLPIVQAQVFTEGFWHSAVQATVLNETERYETWNIHLNPYSEEQRLDEAHLLISRLGENALITGDFNSLSRADDYPDSLIDELAAQGIIKFGTTALRYDTTDYLMENGLIDASVLLNNRANTVPTPANKDKFHADKFRLDYLMITSGLITAVQDIEVEKNSLTDKISDHYPIVATIGV